MFGSKRKQMDREKGAILEITLVYAVTSIKEIKWGHNRIFYTPETIKYEEHIHKKLGFVTSFAPRTAYMMFAFFFFPFEQVCAFHCYSLFILCG